MGKLAHEEYFKTWLLKILINKCSDSLKRRERLVPMAVPEAGEQQDDSNDLDVKDAIKRLEKELKLVVILYYYEDMSVADISQSLRVPLGTVKSRLSRAREKLRWFLQSEERGVL
jgi:RNA polymerase sigma-70 factor (ECF subfamily)